MANEVLQQPPAIGERDVEELDAGLRGVRMAYDAEHLEGRIVGIHAPRHCKFLADSARMSGNEAQARFTDFADQAGRTSPLAVTVSGQRDMPAGESTTFSTQNGSSWYRVALYPAAAVIEQQ